MSMDLCMSDNYLNLNNEYVEKINIIISRYFNDLNNCIEKNEINKNLHSEYLMAIGEGYDFFSDKDEWLENSYKIMECLKEDIEQSRNIIGLGLFGGLCSIGFSLTLFNRKTGCYSRFLNSLNSMIFSYTKICCESVMNDINSMKASYYDVISGLSGIGLYLSECESSKERNEALKLLLECLVHIVNGKHQYKGRQIPNWHIESKNLVREDEKITFPNGNFNFGVAHGLIGIGYTLSKAYSKNITVDGQAGAIKEILDIYKKYGAPNAEGIFLWPGQLKYEDFINDNVDIFRSNRQSWCYGAIGISGVLYMISKMIDDNNTRSFALNNIRKIAGIDEARYQLNSPILCHGYAGALSIFLNIYKDVNDPIIYNRIVKLTETLLFMYIPSSKFGFQDVIYEDIGRTFKTKHVDKNSFLEGTTGIILVLMSLLKKDTYFQKHLLLE